MNLETIIEYTAPASIRTVVFVYDDDDALVDPTSVLITWVDADEEKKVDQEEIVSTGKLETGIFEHFYNTSASSAKGWWNALIEVIDGSGETARTSIGKGSVKVT